MKNIQRKYRNTQLRGVSVVVAEITPEDVADGSTELILSTIPKDSIVTTVSTTVDGVSTTAAGRVDIAGYSTTFSLPSGTDTVSSYLLNKVTRKDTKVIMKELSPFVTGKITAVVTFIRLDAVNGDRVRTKEA